MKCARLLLVNCVLLGVGKVGAEPPTSTAAAHAIGSYPTSLPPALLCPASPAAYGAPMVVPVAVPAAAGPGAFSGLPGVPPALPPTGVDAPPVAPVGDPGPRWGPAAALAPAMYGEALIGRYVPVNLIVTSPGTLNGKTATLIVSPVTPSGTPVNQLRGTTTTGLSLNGVLGNFSLPIPSASQTQLRSYSQTISAGRAALSTSNTTLLNGILQTPTSFTATSTTFVPGTGTITVGQRITTPGLIQADILSIEQAANPRVAQVTGSVALTGGAGTFVAPNRLQYPIAITSLIGQQFPINVPPPNAGGVAGQTRISDDNNPLPRDRLIFDYDYLQNAMLTQAGLNVNRFSVGFEKTFFDQRTSVEVRVPFASTLGRDYVADGTTGERVEMGNVYVTFKGLFYRGEALNLSAGLGVALPTSPDTHVSFGGTEALRLSNDAVVLTPFLACLLTPTDRLFVQNWGSIAFNSQGNRVLLNNGVTGLQDVGRLYDQNLLQIDAQVGYWLIHPGDFDDLLITGLAPFVEAHYTAALGAVHSVLSNAFLAGGTNSNPSEIDLSLGAVVQLGGRMNLTIGGVLPLLGSNRRPVEYEVGVRCNVFFGPTCRDRTAAAEGAF